MLHQSFKRSLFFPWGSQELKKFFFGLSRKVFCSWKNIENRKMDRKTEVFQIILNPVHFFFKKNVEKSQISFWKFWNFSSILDFFKKLKENSFIISQCLFIIPIYSSRLMRIWSDLHLLKFFEFIKGITIIITIRNTLFYYTQQQPQQQKFFLFLQTLVNIEWIIIFGKRCYKSHFHFVAF